jgi:hypothetical protein
MLITLLQNRMKEQDFSLEIFVGIFCPDMSQPSKKTFRWILDIPLLRRLVGNSCRVVEFIRVWWVQLSTWKAKYSQRFLLQLLKFLSQRHCSRLRVCTGLDRARQLAASLVFFSSQRRCVTFDCIQHGVRSFPHMFVHVRYV